MAVTRRRFLTRVAAGGGGSLASTGPSKSFPLVLMALGLMMVGYSLVSSRTQATWVPITVPGVRVSVGRRR